MLWIVPMAGKGKRTQSLGRCKPLIKVAGKYILEWFLLSIRKKLRKNDTILFITSIDFQNTTDIKQITLSLCKKLLNKINVNIVFQDDPQLGPSYTLYLSKSHIAKYSTDAIIVINPDQYVDFELPESIEPKSLNLPVYAEFTSKSSYVKLNKHKQITKITEKDNISNLASAGIYIISDGASLLEAIEKQIVSNLKTNNEFYIGPALNYLLRKKYKAHPLNIFSKYDLGNPSSIDYFEATFVGDYYET